MELTGYFPRMMGIEKRVSGSTKYAVRLSRPPKPRLKTEEVHVRPGRPDPPDQAGIFTIHVVEIEGSQAEAFTPDAEPGISTAAAGQGAPARKEHPASRRTRAATKTAPRPKARKHELENRPSPRPAKNAFCGGQRPPGPGPRPGMAGPGRSARHGDGRGRQRETRLQEIARLERELAELEAEDEGSEPG